jgi:hypothetical protein
MKRITLALGIVVALAACFQAQAMVYVNRDYYWDDYDDVWRYNVVPRHYAGSAAWNVDSDFGRMGAGAPYILESDVYVDAGGTLNIGPGQLRHLRVRHAQRSGHGRVAYHVHIHKC